MSHPPCPTCEGVGGFEGDRTEPGRICGRCDGLGLVEVCEGCHLEPSVQHGVEVCSCTVALPALTQLELSELLDGYIAREHVGVRFLALERFAAQHGYEFKREHGNLYGRLRLVPATLSPAPVMRVITRSDHAAVHGGRPRRAS